MWGIHRVRAAWLAASVLTAGGGCCHCGKKAEPAVYEKFDSGPPGATPAAGAQPQNPPPQRIHGGII